MKTTVFRKVSVKDRLPEIKGKGNYRSYYLTEMGFVYFDKYDGWEKNYNIEWFMEEIELPSEEELRKESLGKFSEEEAQDEHIGDFIEDDAATFMKGANYILNKLK